MYKLLRRLNLIIPGICFFNALHSQTIQQNDDILYWTKKHRLTFVDFKGKISLEDTALHEGSTKMLTHKLGAIVKSIDVRLVTERGKTVFTINAGMKKESSWIKDYGDTVSLKHEQGHFDICEIYARILRRDIQKVKSLSEAKEMYDKIATDEESEQDKYDKENTFQLGGITTDWSEKIINRLKELESYHNPIVTLTIDK